MNTTYSPSVKGLILVSDNFFAEIELWQIWQNDLFMENHELFFSW